MAIYRAHAPIGLDPLASADRTRFVRDGFSFWALVLGPLWLLGHRLWLALGVWLVGAAGSEVVGDRLFLIDPQMASVGSNESLIEDAPWKLVEVLFFQSDEEPGADLGGYRNVFQRDLALLTFPF